MVMVVSDGELLKNFTVVVRLADIIDLVMPVGKSELQKEYKVVLGTM